MSRRLIVVNAVLAGLAILFAAELERELSGSRALPSASAPRVPQPSAPAAQAPSAGTANQDDLPAFSVIASRNLFHPTRSEIAPATASAVTAPVAAAPVPKPYLHGVVMAEGKGRAYLEDPGSKRVFGYAIGDVVGGGTLQQISDDRVVIARPEGLVEVLLRDPSKPRPAPPTPAAAAPQPTARPGPAISGPPIPGPQPGVTSPGVEASPGVPRQVPIPPHLLRRRSPTQPPGDQGSETDG